MRKHILYFSVIIPLFFACSESKTEEKSPEKAPAQSQMSQIEIPESQQLVVVNVPHWDAVEGQLSRYEWSEDSWKEVGEAWPIVVGKAGMAWGKGNQAFSGAEGPIKKEGDKRSPAGIFLLGSAFGYSEAPNWVNMPYIQVVSTTMCIEDGNSNFYNQIIDEGEHAADWNSTDHMLRKDDLYEWGVFVAHNSPEAEAGKGSCIFLHVWRQNDSGTAGCTAMDKRKMQELIKWMDPTKKPILLQMPANIPEFAQSRSKWNLPDA
ncbi:MAG: L,D-transpeptidase family protein [Bacteroidota bacterium]